MQVIKSEMVWFFDVDGTLIEYDKDGSHSLYDELTHACTIKYNPIENNIRLLREKKERGCKIVLWSQGGYTHAAHVAHAIGIADIVDLCMTKPAGIVDDLDPSEWLPRRVFIPIDANYKR